MAINSITSFTGALDAIKNQQALRVDGKTGELKALSGAAKFGLLLQRNLLRKTPEQLGTSQAAIAGAISTLYTNEHGIGSEAQLAKILDKLGFTEFAGFIKTAPDLKTREAKLEKAPTFPAKAKDTASDYSDSADPSVNQNSLGVATQHTAGLEDISLYLQPEGVVTPSQNQAVSQNTQTQAKPAAKFEAPFGDTLDQKIADVKTRLDAVGKGRHINPLRPGKDRPLNPGEGEQELQFLSGHLKSLTAEKAKQTQQSDKPIPAPRAQAKAVAAERLATAATHGKEIAAAKKVETVKTAETQPSTTPKGWNLESVNAKLQYIEKALKENKDGFHLSRDGKAHKKINEDQQAKEFKALTAKKKELFLAKNLLSGVGVISVSGDCEGVLTERLGDKAAQISKKDDATFYDLSADTKKRYKDIGVPRDTAVKLGNGKTFHANFLPFTGLGRQAFATQAPKAESLTEFVQFIEEQNVTTIIDLTNDSDRAGTRNPASKAPNYSRDPAHGFQSVDQTTSSLRQASLEKRELTTANQQKLAYLNFTDWPDHGVVELGKFSSLVNLIKQEQGNQEGGFVIHCTAGVGRTGTVFAGLELSRLAEQGELTQDNFTDKVLDVVAQGRIARGHAFVQTPEQLNLIFEYASTLAK